MQNLNNSYVSSGVVVRVVDSNGLVCSPAIKFDDGLVRNDTVLYWQFGWPDPTWFHDDRPIDVDQRDVVEEKQRLEVFVNDDVFWLVLVLSHLLLVPQDEFPAGLTNDDYQSIFTSGNISKFLKSFMEHGKVWVTRIRIIKSGQKLENW